MLIMFTVSNSKGMVAVGGQLLPPKPKLYVYFIRQPCSYFTFQKKTTLTKAAFFEKSYHSLFNVPILRGANVAQINTSGRYIIFRLYTK